MNKGFAEILLILGIAAVLAVGSIFYTNYKAGEITQKNLGATILTTNLSDTIGTLRTNVNTSITNLNTQLEGVSTTIGTYGNIVSENTPLAANKGGTGLTSNPSDSQILSADGISPKWKNLTSDGSIIITTSTSNIQITTPGINLGANYNWTGTHNFAGTVSATGTTNLTGTTNVSGNLLATGSSNSIATTTFSGTQTFGKIPTGLNLGWYATTTDPGDDSLVYSFCAPSPTVTQLATSTMTTASSTILLNAGAFSTATTTIELRFYVDGTWTGPTAISGPVGTGGTYFTIYNNWLTTVSPGSHTFTLSCKSKGGIGFPLLDLFFIVKELY